MNRPLAVPPFALFEDNLSRPAQGLLLQKHLLTLRCDDPTRADAFFHELEEHRRAGLWIALVAHYELGKSFEAHASAGTAGALLASAMVFDEHLTLDETELAVWWQNQLGALTAQEQEAGLLHLSPTWSQESYATKAQRVLDYICAGDCYQANLSFPMKGRYFGHPLAIYARLRNTQPVKHGALIYDGDKWLLSRSPELFFERAGSRISCRPMKGTAPRGKTEEEDEAISGALQSSEKNRAENLMIVDLIRNDLGRLAKAGDVHVRRLFQLEPYETVFQLTSSVDAAPIDAPLVKVFRALFPCGSVTGAPKVRAMQIIHELEARDRGSYCGAIGWVAPDGDCSFNVSIRTLSLLSDGTCQMDVGSGIVADSEPDQEYAECLTKARFVTDDNLQLIETLRCEVYRRDGSDGQFPLLAWHLQRLARSAQELHFSYDAQTVRAALLAHVATLPLGLQRVRLLLSRDGTFEFSNAPLEAPPEHPTISLASARLDAGDPRLQHKTTARGFYDAALREATAAGHFDVIHLNTRGEVCEGARSNIFIERNGQLLTPPISCGLLPGVMRAQLLASGSAREAILSLDDIVHADRIFVANALRGLLEASLVR